MLYYQDLTEHVAYLDIYTQDKKVIYSIPLSNLNKNDVLMITGQFEVTNTYGYNTMIGSWLILGDSKLSTSGVLIDVANAFNVTPSNHHGVITKARSYKINQDLKTVKYLNLVAWSASENAYSGDTIKVEQKYGHLDLIIFHNKEQE
jgi:hypothetical protein